MTTSPRQTINDWLARFGHVNWAIADQALISGSNFTVGVLLARFLGLEGYGEFVLIYAGLLLLNTVQGAMIIAPMATSGPQILSQDDRMKYMSGMLTLQVIISLIFFGAIVIIGTSIDQIQASFTFGAYIWPCAFTVVGFQLQNWVRRYFYVINKGKLSFANDAMSYGIQLLFVLMFISLGSLTVSNMFWAISISSAIAFSVGIRRKNLWLSWIQAKQSFRMSWRAGLDLLASEQLKWMGGQGILFIGAAFLGVQVVGGIRAAQNILGPLNIFLKAMDNVVPIRAAARYSEAKLEGLTKYIRKTSVWGSAFFAIACFPLPMFSGQIMSFVYGESYLGFGSLVVLESISLFLAFHQRLMSYFHRTVGSTQMILLAATFTMISTVLLSWTLVATLNAQGIILAVVGGKTIGLVILTWTALVHFRKGELVKP